MDHTLTNYGVFRLPFRPQSFCFGGLADRTITLLPIKTIKRVTVLAVCFFSVLRRYGIALSQCVFSPRRQTQMLDSHAIPTATNVVDDHIFRDIAKMVPINYAMCPPAFSSKKENSISINVFLSFINQAIILFFRFFDKSTMFVLRHRHALIS